MDFGLRLCVCRQRPGVADLCLAKTGAHQLSANRRGSRRPKEIAAFSVGQAGWFLLFFALAIGIVILIIAGIFSGKRAKLGGILLGALLIVDLGRANLPWITHWDYKQKYASNPIVDILRDKPYEHRVV